MILWKRQNKRQETDQISDCKGLGVKLPRKGQEGIWGSKELFSVNYIIVCICQNSQNCVH